MFTLPLCVITCFASFVLVPCALCHLIWLSFLCFHPCILCLYANACVLVCLFMSSSLVHTCLYTRDPESLLGTLLDGTHVVCTPIWWKLQYDGNFNMMELWTPNPNLYFLSRTPFFAWKHICLTTCLFDNMFVCPFMGYILFACLFSFGLFVGFVFLLLLHVHAWSEGVTSKMQAKKANAS